ncbi:4'-phosphopantetheinyl transferase superfamily protein [Nocardia anaemiae]|uniref:4'-phosphopantetheinyl transferase superfamily protein n=1 Tax=Nocardia anaemiae TaxID=263910 RepID=UPI0007A3848B|nr:4'-phosphopantetheinyl transferase superfamily protein [Nocardia anaemiae]
MTPAPVVPPDPDSFDGFGDSDRARRASDLLAACVDAPSGLSVRIGVDACDLTLLARQLQSPTGPRFLSNTFTEEELRYCQGRADRLGARWAAKEAVAKAVGTGFRGLSPHQIEIRREADGRPWVHAAPGPPWPGDAHLWEWSVSLGHETDLAIAAAIAVVPTQPIREPVRGRSPR